MFLKTSSLQVCDLIFEPVDEKGITPESGDADLLLEEGVTISGETAALDDINSEPIKKEEFKEERPALWVLDGEELDKLSEAFSKFTHNHLKLLHLVSQYSHKALSAGDSEKFVRRTPLLVLLYEGTVSQLFDYDYAPTSVYIGRRRIYLNVCQDGVDDLDDLREAGYISGLRLSSTESPTVTAYQITTQGYKLLTLVPQDLKDAVTQFVFHGSAVDTESKFPMSPSQFNNENELLEVEFNEDEAKFYLKSASGQGYQSGVTETEDVSYVSSPYLPKCVRKFGRDTSSFAHRAEEASQGNATIRDELSEQIHLTDVSVMVGEWLPFGANQIVELNDKLGSGDRVEGGYFTAMVDSNPDKTVFATSPGMTSVEILDFDLARYLNFEAEIKYPEDPGVIQIENFGVHVPLDGTVFCGLRIDAVEDRIRSNISLDHMARLLVDVHQDSSRILASLISSHQTALIDTTYYGDASSRDKYNLILASEIEPKLKAEKYMDKEDIENELKQVVGQTLGSYDITDDDVLIMGREGLILAGPLAKKYETVLVSFLSLCSRRLYIKNLFNRISVFDDTMKTIRRMIQKHKENPNSIEAIRMMLSNASRDIILLTENLEYADESLGYFAIPKVDQQDHLPGYDVLLESLDVEGTHTHLMMRIKDMRKNVEGAKHELEGLRELADVISESMMFRIQESMQANTKNLEDVFRCNERSGKSLEIMQIILSGTLAFEILDRITGEWSVVDTEWAKAAIVDPLIQTPGVWFTVNMVFWGLLATLLITFMKWFQNKHMGVISLRAKLNAPIDVKNLKAFLKSKNVGAEDVETDPVLHVKKVEWDETDVTAWKGTPPHIEIQYDERYGFILNVFLTIQKREGGMIEDGLKDKLLQDLKDWNVLLQHHDSALAKCIAKAKTSL